MCIQDRLPYRGRTELDYSAYCRRRKQGVQRLHIMLSSLEAEAEPRMGGAEVLGGLRNGLGGTETPQ